MCSLSELDRLFRIEVAGHFPLPHELLKFATEQFRQTFPNRHDAVHCKCFEFSVEIFNLESREKSGNDSFGF